MKFAFYMEPYRIYHSNFYTYQLLYQIFIYKGHTFDFYTPIDYKLDSISTYKKDGKHKNKINVKDINKIYNVNFRIEFPRAEDYDVLLLESQYYKDWCNINRDMRQILASRFKMEKKTVIVIGDSMLLETRLLSLDNIIYGTKSQKLLKLDNVKKYKLSYFFVPPLTYLINPKPNYLAEILFYDKYNLDPSLKIIAFLPGKLEKWRSMDYKDYNQYLFNDLEVNDNYYQCNYQIHWFIKRGKEIIKAFKKLGYQLVGKMHPRDYNKFNTSKTKFGNLLLQNDITYIQQEDLFELYKYSSYAITFASSVVYHTYLYNLPCIEIGSGLYFSNWAYPESTDFYFMKYLKKYNNGKDLIYGHVVDFPEMQNSSDLEDYFRRLLDKEIEFKYKYDNPIYGDSYGKGINDIYKSIVKISTVLYLQKMKSVIDSDDVT